MNKYSVVIGLYAGLKWIKKIVDAVQDQSIPPEKIIIWYNGTEQFSFTGPGIEFIHCLQNYGVYARFTVGLLCDTDRVMILDDDTIPGRHWAKNCFDTVQQVGDNSIIGYRGIRLRQDTLYDVEAYEKGTNEITEVDLVGHSWFVKREHICAMFEDQPVNKFNGEDTHLSAVNHIKYNTKTYVPKQLISEPNTWGSTMQHLGAQPGRLSTSLGPQEHLKQRQEVNKYWINKGWSPFYFR
jgi:hypothetical protein